MSNITNKEILTFEKVICAQVFYENRTIQIECLFCNKIFGTETDLTNLVEHVDNHFQTNYSETETIEDVFPHMDENIFNEVIETKEETHKNTNGLSMYNFMKEPSVSSFSEPEIEPSLENDKVIAASTNIESKQLRTVHSVPIVKLSKDDNYYCPYKNCKHVTQTRELMKIHFIIMHVINTKNCDENDIYQCCFCFSKLSSKRNFVRHLKNVHSITTSLIIDQSIEDGKYYCPVCNDEYLQLNYINKHLRNKHEDFFFKLLEHQHKIIVSNEKFADTQSFSKNNLQDQVNCQKVKRLPQNIHLITKNKKKTTQSNTEIYKCELCERVLSRKSSLVRHHLAVHKIRLDKFMCVHCRKSICCCISNKPTDDTFYNEPVEKNIIYEIKTENYEVDLENVLEEEEFETAIDSENIYVENLDLVNQSPKLDNDNDDNNDVSELDISSEDSFQSISTNALLNESVLSVPVVELSRIDNLYHCPFPNCTRALASENLMQIHLIIIHLFDTCNDDDKFECPRCTSKFNSKGGFIRHLRIVHGILTSVHNNLLSTKKGDKYYCPQCNKKYSQFLQLKMHLNSSHEEYFIVKLEVEKKIGNRKSNSLTSIIDDDEKKPIILSKLKKPSELHCELCGKTVLTRKRMYYHKLTHKERPYHCKCEYCDKKFIFHKNLVHHVEIHKGIKKYKCDHCDNTFLRRADMDSHVNRAHIKTKKNMCEICGKGYYKPSELRNHKLRHTGEKKFKCDQCNKRYYDNTHLNAHLESHSKTKGKRFPCELCGSKFSSTKSLRAHKAIHSNVKKYHCRICNQSFKQNAGLYSHNKTHHKDIIDEKRLLKAQQIKDEELLIS